VQALSGLRDQTPAPAGSVSPEGFFDLFGLTAWNELGQRYQDNDKDK
jgi:hypothetical protein